MLMGLLRYRRQDRLRILRPRQTEAYLLVDSAEAVRNWRTIRSSGTYSNISPPRNVRYFAGSLRLRATASTLTSPLSPTRCAHSSGASTRTRASRSSATFGTTARVRAVRGHAGLRPSSGRGSVLGRRRRISTLRNSSNPANPSTPPRRSISPVNAKVGYTLTLDGRIVSRGTWDLPQGESTLPLRIRPASEGFALLELTLDGGDAARRMIDVLPSFYKVWFAAGSLPPSRESRRFFERFRWLQCDVRVLVRRAKLRRYRNPATTPTS
jgi:hypothetical protein